MVQGGERHRRADPQVRGRCAASSAIRWTDGQTLYVEVVLGQPHGVVAGAVHHLDALERPGVDLLERDARPGQLKNCSTPTFIGATVDERLPRRSARSLEDSLGSQPSLFACSRTRSAHMPLR